MGDKATPFANNPQLARSANITLALREYHLCVTQISPHLQCDITTKKALAIASAFSVKVWIDYSLLSSYLSRFASREGVSTGVATFFSFFFAIGLLTLRTM